ncbi:uncharacterized protein MYCGRDRAFT_105691 [Zymoseptoria tritici IPO323]|uniref:Uncharacterized protein n=1 Tax=Zymoseptoria tritici (strain CBS 115943 / IPO323) TaxID=336722 RepID=F9XJH9_ZYMTI|nr:uncharacterized protein MYCGRDRAFT_105691 [Zymoseptoria tritici IPO323]EGP84742.1 hypothetical protein MYCGRDRAFT_105691 [Zymoseptoria tritici IPO323]
MSSRRVRRMQSSLAPDVESGACRVSRHLSKRPLNPLMPGTISRTGHLEEQWTSCCPGLGIVRSFDRQSADVRDAHDGSGGATSAEQAAMKKIRQTLDGLLQIKATCASVRTRQTQKMWGEV